MLPIPLALDVQYLTNDAGMFIFGFISAHLLWAVLLFARFNHPWRSDDEDQVYLPGRFVSRSTGETFASPTEAYQHAKSEQGFVGPIYPAEWVGGFELVSELELERDVVEDVESKSRNARSEFQ